VKAVFRKLAAPNHYVAARGPPDDAMFSAVTRTAEFSKGEFAVGASKTLYKKINLLTIITI